MRSLFKPRYNNHVAAQYRNLVFLTSAVHLLSGAISYGIVHQNEQLAATESDRQEY